MRKHSFTIAGSSLLLLVASGTSSAAGIELQDRIYIGAVVGQSNIDETLNGTTFDDDDTGWQAFVGYDFSNAFGVEAGWVDMGEYNVGATELGIDGGTVALTGRMPIVSNWSVYIKGGAFFWETDSNAVGLTTDDVDFLAGAGIRFQVPNNENFGVRAEWTYFDSTPQIDMYALGLEVRFD